MRISVAMAVYHGEAYLDAQLSSILSQLEPEDEIIVSDDCPGGKTEEIVRRFARTKTSACIMCRGRAAG